MASPRWLGRALTVAQDDNITVAIAEYGEVPRVQGQSTQAMEFDPANAPDDPGPVFSDQDRDFQGVDDSGDIVIPIPSVFWKLVVARSGSDLQAFAFWLQQDLTQVAFEFSVSADLRRSLISVGELERKLGTIAFPREIHDADQA